MNLYRIGLYLAFAGMILGAAMTEGGAAPAGNRGDLNSTYAASQWHQMALLNANTIENQWTVEQWRTTSVINYARGIAGLPERDHPGDVTSDDIALMLALTGHDLTNPEGDLVSLIAIDAQAGYEPPQAAEGADQYTGPTRSTYYDDGCCGHTSGALDEQTNSACHRRCKDSCYDIFWCHYQCEHRQWNEITTYREFCDGDGGGPAASEQRRAIAGRIASWAAGLFD